jgi:hypothetical protein
MNAHAAPGRGASGAARTVRRNRYSVNFVPFRRLDVYLVELGAVVQIVPEIGSPTLMTLAAAPVDVLVVPVTMVRYFVPLGHVPMVGWDVNFSSTLVTPFPPFHVILVVREPVILLMGTVTFPDPPSANAVGVQVRKLDDTVPVFFVRSSVVVETNFAHATLGFSAADAGNASGTTPTPVANASTSAPARIEVLIRSIPSVRMTLPAWQNHTFGE